MMLCNVLTMFLSIYSFIDMYISYTIFVFKFNQYSAGVP